MCSRRRTWSLPHPSSSATACSPTGCRAAVPSPRRSSTSPPCTPEEPVPVGYSLCRDTGSTVHRGIDPRTKMAWLLAIFAVALCFNHPLVLGAFMAALVLVAVAARLRWNDLRGFVLLSLWLIALSLIIWPAYISEGRPLGRLIGIDFTVDGLLFGLAMGLRITLML